MSRLACGRQAKFPFTSTGFQLIQWQHLTAVIKKKKRGGGSRGREAGSVSPSLRQICQLDSISYALSNS